jgi:transposase
MVLRARIALLSADGLEVHEIGACLSVDGQVVRRWVKRYLEAGFDGLRDRPRSGRPPEIEHHVWQKLATIVVQAPERFGWALARWSGRALAEFPVASLRLARRSLVDQPLPALDGSQTASRSLLAQSQRPGF